jgi:hypothetical protein
LHVESGLIWGDGAFLGFEGGISKGGGITQGGFIVNFGGEYDLSDYSQFVYGVSGGYYIFSYYDYYEYYDYARARVGYTRVGLVAPFIGLRLSVFEFLYRGWIGVETLGNNRLSYNTQLMLGFHFATDKRTR